MSLFVTLSITELNASCRYAECRIFKLDKCQNAECLYLCVTNKFIMLHVIMLRVANKLIMLRNEKNFHTFFPQNFSLNALRR